ncbi:MAG: hypothetical protein KKE30_01905 [Gammaproteobacteria bacterium]|nr:hypothetical protein [Gammaproteobacteria bacterium]MBU1556090.1 hypothetical protein [Gammaproteobacteria bacterium]MBU2070331.1 hypothetical protein [Gammaproteobacteria bacterium]MBU2182354.1 hypothetical protein [Gammaproteobacteria bacterium]MBU2203995.1 hypothetical protein [Gammaproteobacteria bacterium]
MRLRCVLGLAIGISSISFSSVANDFFQIPLAADAREFARLDSKMPAVLSYFSQQTEQELRDFYIQRLGEPTNEQSQYGRQNLYFQVNGRQVRILLSSRDDWRQVDIMLQN